MPREQLRQLASDVARLLGTGAGTAAGDPALRKSGAALRALAARVPALAGIADAVERLTGEKPTGAAAALCDLLLLLRRTQAATAAAGLDGPLVAVRRGGPWQTDLPAEFVSAVFDGLTRRGHWSACEPVVRRGLAPDLRLLAPLLDGLGQRSESLVAFVMGQALPAFGGAAAAAEVRGHWDPRGGPADVRLMELLCRLDSAAGAEACLRGAREGSPLIRQRAFALLPTVAPPETVIPVLTAALGEGAEKTRTCAEQALAQVGGPAVPALVAALNDHGARVRTGAAASLGRMGMTAAAAAPALLRALRDGRASVREAAARALGQIGPEAREAIPTLCELARSDREPGAVARAIGALKDLGADPAVALPVICGALADVRGRRFCVAFAALHALHALGPDGGGAVPALLPLFEDERVWVRTNTALALGSIGPSAAAAVPLLVREMGRPEEVSRRLAAQALGEIGGAARAAVPALGKALDDEEPAVRLAAAVALVRVAGADGARLAGRAAVVRVLAEALEERGYQRNLEKAVQALWRLDPSGGTVIEALLEALRQSETKDRAGVLAYLLRTGAPRERVLNAIGPAREWPLELIPLLSGLGPAEPLIRQLTDAVRLTREERDGSADPARACWLRRVTARALGDFGPAARDAIPALEELSRSANVARFDAALALARITEDLTPVMQVIRPALKGDADRRAWAAGALGQLGGASAPFVPELVRLLDDGEDRVRLAAVDALGKIGAPARGAAPALVARLDAEPKWLRGHVTHALLKIGAEVSLALASFSESYWEGDLGATCYAEAQRGRHSREELRRSPAVVPALRDALGDEDELTRLRAALTLACLEADVGAAIPVLAEAASVDPHDGHIRLRVRAADLLASFGERAAGALPGLTAALTTLRHWGLRSAVRRAVARIESGC